MGLSLSGGEALAQPPAAAEPAPDAAKPAPDAAKSAPDAAKSAPDAPRPDGQRPAERPDPPLPQSGGAGDTVPVRLFGRWGEGFGVESVDGSFRFGISARTQIRGSVVVFEQEGVDPTADFMIRRARLTVSADGWDGLVSLKLQLAFSPLDQDPVAPLPVRDAFVTVSPSRDLAIRAGQMKVPFGRQRVISSGQLQMVDRSIVTAELNLDRDVGVQIFSEDLFGLDGWLGYAFGVFGGDGRNRVSGGYGLLYAARVALRPLGGARGEDLDEVDFSRSAKPRLSLAASGAFNHDTDRERSTIGPVFANGPWADYVHAGGDVSFKWRGLAVTGEVFLRRALDPTLTAEVDGALRTDETRSGRGGFFQVGQLIGGQFEVTGRVGSILPAGAGGAPPPASKELGGALSYYGQRHALKVQLDTFYVYQAWGHGSVEGRLQLQVAP